MDKLPAGYPLLSFLHNSISDLLPCRLPEAISLQIMIFELLWQPFETHLIIFLWELMIACETIIGGGSLLQSAILTPYNFYLLSIVWHKTCLLHFDNIDNTRIWNTGELIPINIRLFLQSLTFPKMKFNQDSHIVGKCFILAILFVGPLLIQVWEVLDAQHP